MSLTYGENMPEIRLAKEGGLAWFTIDHQERHNALTQEMMGQLAEGLEDVAVDQSVRAIIITGAGEKAFASGGDISRFGETRKDFEATQKSAARRKAIFERMNSIEKPVIAMIRGYCMGGGLAVAMETDLRFASSDATFAIPAAKLGIAYTATGMEKLSSLVGISAAKDILFSGRRLKAEEALSLGLINRVLPADELEPYTREYCQQLAMNAPLSIAASKFVLTQLALPPASRDNDRILEKQRVAAESEDIKEGRKAFLEKRKPVFRGM